tara:strand:+ start:12770 stop:13111 length:342 start_codon:yes stop_codon:yes gene_type:complete
MCFRVKNINTNDKGQLSYCENCKIFHLIFNNLYIDFTPNELISFQNVIEKIECEYWETRHNEIFIKRKIPVQTSQPNLCMIFNRDELDSLKDLINCAGTNLFNILSSLDINYN